MVLRVFAHPTWRRLAHGRHVPEPFQHPKHLLRQARRNRGEPRLGRSGRVDGPVPLPCATDKRADHIERSLNPFLREVPIAGTATETRVEKPGKRPRTTPNDAPVASMVLHARDNVKHFFEGSRDELSKIVFVGGDSKTDDPVSGCGSFRDVQPEEARNACVKRDFLWHRPRHWMWEDRPKLVSSDEGLTMDFDLGGSPVESDFGQLDGRDDFVALLQLFRKDPLRVFSPNLVPAHPSSMVAIPIAGVA